MSALRISAFFAPVRETPDHIALAEELGFSAAWCYDSPLLYHDPFVTLARAADRTRRIGLGVGVMVPGLRAPVVTAAALRSLSALAPGRVVASYGVGFTGRFTLGLPPASLRVLEREMADVRGLLAGEEVPHAEGGAPVRAIPVSGAEGAGDVPIFMAVRGVRAQAMARRVADGAITGIFYPGGLGLVREGVGAEMPLLVHAVGSVAEEGEPLDSARLTAAVGPVVAVAFHQFYEQPWRLEGMDAPARADAEAYIAAMRRRLPARSAHLDLHLGHLVEVVHEEDRERVTPGNVGRFAFCGTADQLRERARGLAANDVTELCVQPGGDIPDELRRLAAALIQS
jgi:5,10-methylenetetrahydromethanopterin reductase